MAKRKVYGVFFTEWHDPTIVHIGHVFESRGDAENQAANLIEESGDEPDDFILTAWVRELWLTPERTASDC